MIRSHTPLYLQNLLQLVFWRRYYFERPVCLCHANLPKISPPIHHAFLILSQWLSHGRTLYVDLSQAVSLLLN